MSVNPDSAGHVRHSAAQLAPRNWGINSAAISRLHSHIKSEILPQCHSPESSCAVWGWGLAEPPPDPKAGHSVPAELYWAFCLCLCRPHRAVTPLAALGLGCDIPGCSRWQSLSQSWRDLWAGSCFRCCLLTANSPLTEVNKLWEFFTAPHFSLKGPVDHLDRCFTTQGAAYLWLINSSKCCNENHNKSID